MMLRPRPTQPMMRISLTSETSLSEMKRSIDCNKMLAPRANKKAPLKKAPSSRARCQPKEKSWRYSVLSVIYPGSVSRDLTVFWRTMRLTTMEARVTTKPTKSFSYFGYRSVYCQPVMSKCPTNVVKGVGHEGQTARLEGN